MCIRDSCDGDGTSCVVGCMDSTACNYNPGAGVPGDCFTLDSCGVCGGADASLDCGGDCFGSFSAGTFGLTPNDDMTDWTLQASTADESSAGWWSIGNCSNFALGGGGVNCIPHLLIVEYSFDGEIWTELGRYNQSSGAFSCINFPQQCGTRTGQLQNILPDNSGNGVFIKFKIRSAVFCANCFSCLSKRR